MLVNGPVQQAGITSTAPSITPPLAPGAFTAQKPGYSGAAGDTMQPLIQALMKAKMQQKLAGQLPGTTPAQPPAGGQGGTAADSYMPLSLGGQPIGPP